MFLDTCKIYIKAGNGGDGHASFRREKYVARGGPDGGDGGSGGSVIFEADAAMSTLSAFRYKQHFRANNGENGAVNNKSGKSAEALIIKVPVGTLVKAEDGRVLADMSTVGEQKLILRGGRGGRGNARFATPTRQAPKFAQPGEKTTEFAVRLELKTIADVGLIGLPNVGKSTMLAALTAARPKIANYHFTTLAPNLGVVERYDKTFVLADIPGLIEGAAEGAGLGHDFLRHVERTRMLLHVLDVSGSEGRDPIEDFYALNRELSAYSDKLSKLPQLVVANKIDIDGADENLVKLKAELEPKGYEVFPISAAAEIGLDELIARVFEKLKTLPPVHVFEEEAELDQRQYGDGFEITRDGEAFIVNGGVVERLLDTTDPNDVDSMRRFQQELIRTGIIAALREKGATEGSAIHMGEWEFNFIE